MKTFTLTADKGIELVDTKVFRYRVAMIALTGMTKVDGARVWARHYEG